ncbi:transcriptional repressor [Marine Group I thaumarchaeote]|uniref:Transcriptional repressor n=1 Tax=Marine Group I thaumarchaeote TaxID=2511932 RepID=A0A7K4MME8_9ARCH|nr:transcriptional repressor [Marine Group I thaumarchaeote]
MTNKELINNFKTVLKTENMKFTPQRLLVLKEMVNSKEHRECEEIYLALRKAGNNVSRATVYRTMDILVKHDFARKLDIGDGKSRYETKINHPHHDHMICIECGSITEFMNDDIEDLQDDICKQFDFKLIRHIHQLFGVCKKCSKKS